MTYFADNSADFYRAFADSSHDWECWRGPDNNFIYISPSSESVTGYQPQEFYFDHELFFKIIHPDDLALVKEHIANILEEQAAVELEFRIIHRDGNVKWIRHHCYAAYDQSGRLLGRRSTNRDVSEIKELSNKLAASHKNLLQTLEAAQAGAWSLDIETGQFSFEGNNFIEAPAADQIKGMQFPAVAPEDVDRIAAAMRISIENRTPFNEDFRLALPDGTKRWVRCKSGYIDAHSSPKVVGLMWDITERKTHEQEILRLRDELKELAQFPLNNPNIVLRTTHEGSLIFKNPAAQQNPFTKLLELNKQVPEPFQSCVKDAVSGMQTKEQMCQCDDRFFWLIFKADETGVNIYAADYTKRTKIEQSLSLLSQMAGKLLKSDDPAALSKELFRDVTKHLDCDFFLLYLADETKARLYLRSYEGVPGYFSDKLQVIEYGTFMCGHAASERKPIVREDILNNDDPQLALAKSFGIQAYACYPMLAPGKYLLGTLSFGSLQRRHFSEDELSVMEAAADLQAAVLYRVQAEQSLKDSRQDLSHAQSIAHIGSWRLDIVSGELVWSDETYNIFGIPAGTTMTYDSFIATVHPQDRAFVQKQWNSALKGERYNCEHRIIVNKDIKWVREQAEMEFTSSGELISALGTVQDITKHRYDQDLLLQTQQELYNSNQLLQRVLDNTHVLVACMDRNFNYIRVNKAYADANGLEVDFFHGKNHFNLYPNTENEAIFRNVVETGQPHIIHARAFVCEKDPEMGTTYWDWSLAPVLDEKGMAAQVVLTLADVTAQKKSQLLHERNMKRQMALVKASQEILAADNTDSLLETISRTAMTITTANVALAQTIYDKQITSSVASAENYSLPHRMSEAACKIFKEGFFRDVFEQGNTVNLTQERLQSHPHLIDMPQGHVLIRGLLATPLFDSTGAVNGLIVVSDKQEGEFTCDDESELKQLAAISSLALQHLEAKILLAKERDLLEKRVLQRTEDFRRTAEDLEQTVTTLGDEVAQRLRVEADLQSTNVELARRAQRLAKMASELTVAEHRERYRIAQILHDHLQQLLVAAKLELSTVLNKVKGDCRTIIESVLSHLSESIKESRSLTVELYPPILYESGLAGGLEWLVRWMREKHGFTVELDLKADANIRREDICILLFQSIRELLFNTVKHSGVHCARLEMRKKGDFLKVTIRDEGKGFDPDKMSDTQEDSKKGFGIFSIRERLSSIGGKLEIESTPGKGSTFILTAPADVELKCDELTTPSKRRIQSISSPPLINSQLHKIKIMLVDDHTVMRRGLATLLRQEPDMIVAGEAADGEEAVAMAGEIKPDIILMDYSLPGMSGAEAAAIICGRMPDVRVIGLSMFDEQDRAAAMFEAGASAYASKSESPAILLSSIRSVASTIRNRYSAQQIDIKNLKTQEG